MRKTFFAAACLVAFSLAGCAALNSFIQKGENPQIIADDAAIGTALTACNNDALALGVLRNTPGSTPAQYIALATQTATDAATLDAAYNKLVSDWKALGSPGQMPPKPTPAKP